MLPQLCRYNIPSLSFRLRAGPRGNQASPTTNKVLNGNANDIRSDPVESQATRELETKKGKHYWHHPQHHVAHGLLPGIGNLGCHHLLLNPHRAANQKRQEEIAIGLCQVKPEEASIQGHHLMDNRPGVKVPGKFQQTLGGSCQSLHNRLVEGNPDR